MNLWVIFLTGLTTGGISCLAMQGGLLAGVIANQKGTELEGTTAKERRKMRGQFDQLDWLPVAMFLGSKLAVHTVFGLLLGALGAVISLSLGVRLAFQVFAALFMFGTAMNLLNVHPVFRYLAFQPPKFMQKWVRGSTKSRALFAPAVLGAMTIFIPCGVTQAMEVLAINTGSAITGAGTMFAFVLGTFPLFALIGVATAKLSEGWQAAFMKVAAVVLVGMSVYGLNGVLLVVDSPFAVQNVVKFVEMTRGANKDAVGITGTVEKGVQKVTINVLDRGYSPNRVQVKAGAPVELTLKTNGVYSCASAFIFREFGISAFLKPTDTKTFTFTPTKKGRFRFSCSMGMYTGVMEVL